MKRLLLLFSVWTTFCSFAQTANWNDSVQLYISQARLLNADAYVKLADCYHKGLGVERNFAMVMSMLMDADRYADEGRVSEKYIASLPEDDADRLTFEALMTLDEHHIEEAKSVTERLLKVSPQAGKVLLAVLAIEERNDTASFRRLINEGIDEGYSLASVMLAQRYEADGKKDAAAKIMEEVADRVPMAYCYLGKYYIEQGERQKGVEYYRKADQWACLNREGAEVLLEEMDRQEEHQKRNKYEENRLRLIIDGIGG